MENIHLHGRIWLTMDGEASIGSGKIRLLRKVAELGSLRKAALETGISYRRAWYSIDQLNKVAGSPVVILRRGGKEGGIATVTDLGHTIIRLFSDAEQSFARFLEAENQRIPNS